MNSENHGITRDVARTTLAVLCIGVLIGATFWILRPFLTSIVWATIIVVATWPLLQKLQSLFRGRRWLATAAMTAMLLLVIILPLMLAVATIAGKADDIAAWVRSFSPLALPSPPAWVETIPLVGRSIAERWHQFIGVTPEEFTAQLTPYAKTALQWFVARAGSFAAMMIDILLTVVITAVMYSRGEAASAGIRAFARRLAGAHGEETAVLAAKAIRSVAMGIVVTALVQTILGGLGLLIAGMPAAPLLAAVMLMLCLAQLGPTLVLAPSVVWLYWSGQIIAGTFLLVIAIVAGTIDNFLRPLLIRKGVDISLVLIFAGVIGGLMAFGVVGLFIGPVVLTITMTLLDAWMSGESQGSTGPEEG